LKYASSKKEFKFTIKNSFSISLVSNTTLTFLPASPALSYFPEFEERDKNRIPLSCQIEKKAAFL